MHSLLFVLSFVLAVAAMPQQTPSPSAPGADDTIPVTAAPPASLITAAPALTCSDGSTVLYTTDCTMGTLVSYCHSPEPPIQCGSGYFPSVYHPGHCLEMSTCFPVDASWLTTECSNGMIAYATSTYYQGTLADGKSTVISGVQCSCSSDNWYSATQLPGSPLVDTFCMPYSNCPPGMTTSVSTNSYCATAPPNECQGISVTTNFCKCEHPTATAVYPDGDGAQATGCA